MSNISVPDFDFIDTVLLAYRLGHVRYDEQKTALLAAARAAKDAITFLTALENFGVGRRTQLLRAVGEILSAISYYRAQYPQMVGLRREGEAPQPFLDNQYVMSLMDPLLMSKQQDAYYKVYWWFNHNYEEKYYEPKKGWVLGVYASEPRDNASVIHRFEENLLRLANHGNAKVRELYASFPIDMMVAVLRRAFT